jgi:hypothetical protein
MKSNQAYMLGNSWLIQMEKDKKNKRGGGVQV